MVADYPASAVPPQTPDRNAPPLTYEQCIHGWLYKAKVWGEDLVGIFERNHTTLKGYERELNAHVIADMRESLAELPALIDEADRRRPAAMPTTNVALADHIAALLPPAPSPHVGSPPEGEPVNICSARRSVRWDDLKVRHMTGTPLGSVAAVCWQEAGHSGWHYDPALRYAWNDSEPPPSGQEGNPPEPPQPLTKEERAKLCAWAHAYHGADYTEDVLRYEATVRAARASALREAADLADAEAKRRVWTMPGVDACEQIRDAILAKLPGGPT